MHILKPAEIGYARRPSRPYAAVTVKVVPGKRGGPRQLRVVPGSISIVRTDAQFVRLPEDIVVLPPEGSEDTEPVQADRGFWISIESIDPYHVLLDAPPDLFR